MFTVDAYPKTITVTPQSKAGSNVGTINFLIKESQANNTMIYFYNYVSNLIVTIHNNSGEQILHYHDIHPTVHILVRNTNDTIASFRYWSPFQFQDIASAQCVYNSITYLTVSLDIVLSSDSLYHLGDHVIYLAGLGYNGIHGFDFSAIIYLRVQAGMDMFMGSYMHAC